MITQPIHRVKYFVKQSSVGKHPQITQMPQIKEHYKTNLAYETQFLF